MDSISNFFLFNIASNMFSMFLLFLEIRNTYKYSKGGCQEDGARSFSVMPNNRTVGREQKLKYRKFHLNMTKNFFMMGMTAH